MLQDAISTYHDLLDDPGLAADCQERLDDQQRRRHLSFGGRPLCTVLRPRFLTSEQYRLVRQRVRVLMGAFGQIHRAAAADANFRRQFRLTAEEEELFALDPGYPCPMPTSRLDAFFVTSAGGRRAGALRFTEFNAETPAGAAYSDELADVFAALPAMAAFQRRFDAVAPPVRPGVYNALVESYVKWLGRRELPRVAILDWKEVPTYTEFELFREYFRRQGLQCVIADPREVEYRQGRLMAGDFHVTLIYKRVLIGELIERCGMGHAVVRAVRDRAACMANPFRCKPLYKKASLAALSDEANVRLFAPAQQEAIAEHVPWTRVVEERKTVKDGEPVDLVPYVSENKDTLVLKPNDDYGGKGIVLGWTVDGARWRDAVRVALEVPYVVQERVELPTEPFASWDGGLRVSERMLDTAPFVSGGEYVEGCLTRIGTDPLLNVTAGGGSTVPTFVIEAR